MPEAFFKDEMEFWVDEAQGESVVRSWDKLQLGNIVFPGIARVDIGVGLDIQPSKVLEAEAQGTNPAKFKIGLTDNGYQPARVKATIEIWDRDQWEDMKETLPKFTPVSGDKQGSSIGGNSSLLGTDRRNPRAKRLAGSARDAFDILHPAANLLGVNHVIVNFVTIQPIAQQTFTVVLDMIQYFPQTGRRVLHGGGGPLTGSEVADVKPADNFGE